MSLVLAAAGRGSRLGELTVPKPLVREPVFNRPLLSHIYERLEREGALDHIVIVGASGADSNRMLIDFTREFPFRVKPQIHLVEGERRGVGYAFLLGVDRLVELRAKNAVLSVADSIPLTYRNIVDSVDAVTIGVTDRESLSEKVHTTISVDNDGFLIPRTRSEASAHEKKVVRGVYHLKDEALGEFASRMRHAFHARQSDSDVVNEKGEMKVTWAWYEMQAQGTNVRAASLERMMEVNTPQDLLRAGTFFKGN
jgi:NDP-sugar pyrophosphorylase family protein